MNNSSVIIVVLVAALLVIVGIGYVGHLAAPGSDADAHGCIGSAGYSWCNATQKCIRSWEENCTAIAPPPTQAGGNAVDSHGCKSSEGYTWCAAKQKCLRVWEEKCETVFPEGTVPNAMHASVCPSAGGHVVDVTGETLCPEGEFPIAEVFSETGARQACCRADVVR